jgi:hypothetical protein
MNKKILGLVGVATLALGALVIIPNITQAYRGDATVKGPNYTVERHDAMEKAFDNKDFTAWQKLMTGRGRVTQVINKDNFAKFAEIHKLSEEGKTVEDQKLRAELGLGLHNGQGKGQGQGMGRGMGGKNR